MNAAIWGMNSRLTNVTNIHTCSTSSMDLISTVVWI
jgi:hypothetical protein